MRLSAGGVRGGGTRRVLATGGVPIAGDVFDQKLVRARLPRHFGERGTYGAKGLPIPKWIYDTFSNWRTILELQTPENRGILQQIEQTARHPREIRALNSLVSGNYGLQLFDAVESTKRDLSDRFGGMIRLKGPHFDVMELVTRRDFENIIRPEYLRIERELDETVTASGLTPGQIDAVIRTGGSAQIPLFQQMLQKKFGADRVHSIDTFGSVTSGLGILAHHIEAGEVEARAYTRQDLRQQEISIAHPNVSVVDLRLVKRRMQARALGAAGTREVDEAALVVLTGDNRLLAQLLPEQFGDAGHRPHAAKKLNAPQLENVALALHAAPDEPLLLVTSRYRFLLSSARQLMDLQALGQSLAELHHFGTRERIFAVNRWVPIKESERLLLATSVGYARGYPAEVIAASIEAPVPLVFEQPLPGWPITVLGVHAGEQLLMLTDGGRGLRRAVRDIPGIGLQLLKRADDEAIVSVLAGDEKDDLLLVTAGGYARRLPLTSVFEAPKVNHPGRVLISRRPLRAATLVRGQAPVWLLTSSGLRAIGADGVPCEPGTTRSHQLLPLDANGEVLNVVADYRRDGSMAREPAKIAK
jgi:hypothetical protein